MTEQAEYRQEGRQLTEREETSRINKQTEAPSETEGQMDMQTARLDGEFWRQVDKQTDKGRLLPGDQTAGLMICSRHTQCETGRMPLPCSAAPPLLTYTPTNPPPFHYLRPV